MTSEQELLTELKRLNDILLPLAQLQIFPLTLGAKRTALTKSLTESLQALPANRK